MKFRTAELLVFVIIVVSLIIAAYYYPLMPERVASHWNAQGIVDGYMGKFWALLLMPLISILILAVFIIIPRIDPLAKNIQEFRKYFDIFIILISLFLLYLYLLTIAWNIGLRFNLIQFLAPAFGILFFYIGVLLKHSKQNWSIGIRTPWTLSNAKVWEKTHAAGGLSFKACGIIAVLGAFFPEIAIWLVLAPIIIVCIFLFGFSYLEFKKLEEKHS